MKIIHLGLSSFLMDVRQIEIDSRDLEWAKPGAPITCLFRSCLGETA